MSRQRKYSFGEGLGDESEGAILRKVQSVDFASLRQPNRSLCHLEAECKASRFSLEANEGIFSSKRRWSSSRLQPIGFDPLLDPAESDSEEESSFNMHSNGGRSTRLTLGYVSVLLLGGMTVSNFILEIVDAQMHTLDSPSLYDALSTEVIAPPFSYKKVVMEERPRLGLGSAAISSVTDVLSPILPFTGGLDLRREWEVKNSLSHVLDQVREAFGLADTIPRGGEQPSADQNRTILYSAEALKKAKSKHVLSLSAPTPFVSVSTIADMTLADLTMIFKYVIEHDRDGVDQKKFQNSLDTRLKLVVTKMNAAIATSRGDDVLSSKTHPLEEDSSDALSAAGYGDIDALQFCAAMRLFAEWRLVRQVPDGYKGYAVGMNLGHKDVVQNVAKIETAVHKWLDYRRGLLELQSTWSSENDILRDESPELRSPTLRDLLEYEVDMETHGSNRLPRLKDKTAAMGLLWVRRQLHYQTALFANIIRVPDKFPTTIDAINAAYTEVYDKYHGWAVQKIFTYSFQAAPDVKEIYKFMNPSRLKEVYEEARLESPSETEAMPVNNEKNESAAVLNNATSPKEGNNPFEQFGNHIAQEWDKLGKNVGGAWDNFIRGLVCKDRQCTNTDVRGGAGDEHKGLQGRELDDFVEIKMSLEAHKHIVQYLEVVQPLLKDVAGLFHKLNMDDPTKV